MKNILLKLLKTFFKIDVKKIVRQYEKIKSENVKLTEENSILNNIKDQNKTLESEKQELLDKLEETEKINTRQKETLQQHINTIEKQNNKILNHNNEIGKLKELISSHQTDIKILTEKDKTIKELRKLVVPVDKEEPEIPQDFTPLKQKFEESSQFKYIRFTTLPYGIQLILQDSEITEQEDTEGVNGFNTVSEKNTFIPFSTITEIEGLTSPFKQKLYHKSGDNEDTGINYLINEAIYNCNPIRIEYGEPEEDITFQNLSQICYSGESVEYLCDRLWDKYYEPKGTIIEAFCMLDQETKIFYNSRIQSIQVFNMHDFGLGHLTDLSTALWQPLVKSDMELAVRIADLIPDQLIDTDHVTAGNYAHFLLLSGEKEKALDIYRKHEGEQVYDEITWKEMNLNDFEELKKIADYEQKFQDAVEELGW